MWIWMSVLSAIAYSSQVEGLKILGLFPYPGGSHQRMYDKLMIKLLERGHSVTAVSHYALKDTSDNYRYIDFNSSATHTGALSLEPFDSTLYGFEGLIDALLIYKDYIVEHGVAACEQILSSPAIKDLYFGDEQFDLIITESFNSDFTYIFAEKLNLPVVTFEAHQIPPWVNDRFGQPDNPSYMPNFLSRSSDNMPFLERLENTILHYIQKYSYRYLIQREEERIIREQLGVEIESLEEIAMKRTVLLLSNTYHVLNRPRPLVPLIRETGGMHLKNKLEQLDKDIEQLINESKHGVILFTFGSLLNTSTIAPEKMKVFIQVFSELPQTVIWKYDDPNMPNRPKNVKLVKWLQQEEILAHPNVRAFIAHGGLFGVTEAVNYGVPTLVLSVLGDQHLNGAAVEESGLGATMMYRHVTEERLREALKKVLSPEMQSSAKKVSRQWRDRPLPPIDTAIFWIEFVGRNPTAQLWTKARDLPFYSHMLLDVAFVTVFIIAAICFIIYATLKVVYVAIFGSSALKNKKPKIQ